MINNFPEEERIRLYIFSISNNILTATARLHFKGSSPFVYHETFQAGRKILLTNKVLLASQSESASDAPHIGTV